MYWLTNSSPIITIYLYIFIFIIFFLLYQDISRNQSLSFFYDLHLASADRLRKLIFMLVLTAFLGTPVTVGFFYKVAIFNALVNTNLLSMISAIILNLIMVIFYLQASRHSQVSRRKKKNQVSEDINTGSKSSLVFITFLVLGAPILVPVTLDIIVTLLS